MKLGFIILPKADQDIDRRVEYLKREAGTEVALRFFQATMQAFAQLVEMPEAGSPRRFAHRSLLGLRQWPVPGFERVLIFYRPTTSGIEVIRVLHGAQDTRAILRRSTS